jgi:hypothetical protein
MKSLKYLALTIALATVVSMSGSAEPIVEFRTHARIMVAPATVRMLIVVQPNDANRTLHVELDGDLMYRSSDMALEGAGEKKFHQITFRGVPPGHYRLAAVVLSATAVRGQATDSLDVLD